MAATTDVRMWTNAEVYTAPAETAGPTDTTSDWSASWTDVGLLAEDAGISDTQTVETTELFAYGGILVRKGRSKFVKTLTMTLLSNADVVFKLTNPGSTSTGAGDVTRTVLVPTLTSDIRAFGLNLTDGDTIARRVYATAEITEVGDAQMLDNALYARPITITVYPDDDGVLYTEVTNDAAAGDAWDPGS
jgi:hypothetical protein